MNIDWYNKNNDTIISNMTNSSQLIKKIVNEDSENTLETIHLIFANKKMMHDFIKNIKSMYNAFDNLNFRLGVLSDSHDVNYIAAEMIESKVLFFGTENEKENYKKVFKNDCVGISAICNGKISTIGYQRHLSQELHPLSVSLGEMRNDFGLAEASLRKSKAVFLELDVLRRQDSFSNSSRITGLDIYEICQLMRYLGLSDTQEFIFINVSESDSNPKIWDAISTFTWYYFEGLLNCQRDKQESEFNKYLVESEYFENGITFYNSPLTNRWWFSFGNNSMEKIPCSEQDYIKLRAGEMTELVDKYFLVDNLKKS